MDKKVKDISLIFDILKNYTKEENEEIIKGVSKLIGLNLNDENKENNTVVKHTALSFYKEKKPKGQRQELLVLCYFLEHYKKMEWFTSKDVEQAIEEARLPKIKDLDKVFYELKRRKVSWIRTKGKSHQLTHEGLDVVENQLPKNSL